MSVTLCHPRGSCLQNRMPQRASRPSQPLLQRLRHPPLLRKRQASDNLWMANRSCSPLKRRLCWHRRVKQHEQFSHTSETRHGGRRRCRNCRAMISCYLGTAVTVEREEMSTLVSSFRLVIHFTRTSCLRCTSTRYTVCLLLGNGKVVSNERFTGSHLVILCITVVTERRGLQRPVGCV